MYDPGAGEDVPYAVLTGDTLFIGEVGAPDLSASLGCSAEQLASMVYDSLHKEARSPGGPDVDVSGARRELLVR